MALLDDRRLGISFAEFGRYAVVSGPLCIAIFYLMFFFRRDVWSGRLVLFALLFSLSGNVSGVISRFLLLKPASRSARTKLQVLIVLMDFASGCASFLLAKFVTDSLHLPAFVLSGSERRLAILLCGGVSATGGLLFYLYHITRKRLRRSIERSKNQQMAERELELARAVQKRLLPPEHLRGDGYEIVARNLAAYYVAGDYYDVFRLADGAVGIVVADVAGKGIGASLIVATVKATLPLIAENVDANIVLAELSARLTNQLTKREFVALAYGRYYPESGRLQIANAGLPDPFILRNGRVPEPLIVPGPRLPLGIKPHVPYECCEAQLNPTDRVLLFTDGLPEATTPFGEPVGYSTFTDLVAIAAQADEELIDALFAAVRETSSPNIEDDWTVLVLQAKKHSCDVTA